MKRGSEEILLTTGSMYAAMPTLKTVTAEGRVGSCVWGIKWDMILKNAL